MPHGFDYTSSVGYADTFPSKGKARSAVTQRDAAPVLSAGAIPGYRKNV